MNKQAQVAPLGLIASVFCFLLVWAIWLGGFLNEAGQIAIEQGGYTGFEAFFYSNLNLWVLLGLLLGIMGYMYFFSGQ